MQQILGVPEIKYEDVNDLPGIYEEEKKFKEFFPDGDLFIDPPAESTALFRTKGGLLHIACHGNYDTKRPMLSRLLFADRPVFAFELIAKGIKADHLVMTACRAGESQVNPGGYTHSIASAFLKAGVKEIVAALWPVDDKAGALFSGFFYEEYAKTGSMINALRAAQLHLRREPAFKHPHFWAPFVLFGIADKPHRF